MLKPFNDITRTALGIEYPSPTTTKEPGNYYCKPTALYIRIMPNPFLIWDRDYVLDVSRQCMPLSLLTKHHE